MAALAALQEERVQLWAALGAGSEAEAAAGSRREAFAQFGAKVVEQLQGSATSARRALGLPPRAAAGGRGSTAAAAAGAAGDAQAAPADADAAAAAAAALAAHGELLALLRPTGDAAAAAAAERPGASAAGRECLGALLTPALTSTSVTLQLCLVGFPVVVLGIPLGLRSGTGAGRGWAAAAVVGGGCSGC